MVRKIIALVAIASGFVLTACNTVEGAGRDVESVGKATQDAAN
jgi:predicted small secreted protein